MLSLSRTALPAIRLMAASCVLASTQVDAAIIHVPSEIPTIQQAIDTADEGDLILVAPGLYAENLVFSTGRPSMTVLSEGGPDVTTIHGQLNDHTIVCAPNSAPITIEGFTITGGRASLLGGGISCVAAHVIIRGNVITENEQIDYGGAGGGIWMDPNCSPQSVVEWNLISHNTASNGGGIASRAPILMRNNTIVANTSVHQNGTGGGIRCMGGVIERNIIALNHADDGGGIYCGNAWATISCNDIWANTDLNTGGPCVLEPDNLAIDPEFCAPELDDYALQESSPCLPGHSPPGCGLIGAFDLGCGPVPVGSSTWGRIKLLFEE